MWIRAIWQGALLLGLAAAGAVLTWRYHPERPELYLTAEPAAPGEITVDDALALAGSGGVIWIDARQESEFAKGHIPGAILLNEYNWFDLLAAAFEQIAYDDAQRPIIVYCDGRKCEASHAVRRRLLEDVPLADRPIHVLRGGWPAWQAAQAKRGG